MSSSGLRTLGADTMDAEIKRQLNGCFHPDVDVELFVKTFFKLDEKVVNTILGPDWTPVLTDLENYRRLLPTVNKEKKLYPHVVTMAHDLREAVVAVLAKAGILTQAGTKFAEHGGEKLFVLYPKGPGAKPDFYNVFLQIAEAMGWLDIKHPGEVKRTIVPDPPQKKQSPPLGTAPSAPQSPDPQSTTAPPDPQSTTAPLVPQSTTAPLVPQSTIATLVPQSPVPQLTTASLVAQSPVPPSTTAPLVLPSPVPQLTTVPLVPQSTTAPLAPHPTIPLSTTAPSVPPPASTKALPIPSSPVPQSTTAPLVPQLTTVIPVSQLPPVPQSNITDIVAASAVPFHVSSTASRKRSTSESGSSAPNKRSKKSQDGSQKSRGGPRKSQGRPKKSQGAASFTSQPTGALRQLGRYSAFCLASSHRIFNIGISIRDTKASLSYFDRMAGFQSKWFDFVDQPKLFALIIYALTSSTAITSGSNPFLYAPNDINSPTTIRTPISEMTGAFFKFPKTTGLPKIHQFFNFKIVKTIHFPIGIIGRVTGVYHTIATNPDQPGISRDAALKLSWQPTGPKRRREPEATTIQNIRDRVPPMWRRHLPEILFGATYTPEALGIPWYPTPPNLNVNEDLERRDLHVLATPLYRRLEEVNTAEELFIVWCHAFEAHHQVYAAGKYLHRDLSINNIMFTRDGDNGPVIGILNDFDLALDVDPKNQGTTNPATTPRASGTLPFMASDLHQDPPPSQHYHHELESLVYVLLFVASHLDLKQHKYRSTPELLRRWNSIEPQDLYDMKAGWRSPLFFDMLLTKVLVPEFKPLHTLLYELSWLFAQATMEVDKEIKKMRRMEGEVDPTVALASMTARRQDLLSQKITYDTFKAVVKDHCGNYPYPDESSVQPPTAS